MFYHFTVDLLQTILKLIAKRLLYFSDVMIYKMKSHRQYAAFIAIYKTEPLKVEPQFNKVIFGIQKFNTIYTIE